jgi:DNA replication protein DnaC
MKVKKIIDYKCPHHPEAKAEAVEVAGQKLAYCDQCYQERIAQTPESSTNIQSEYKKAGIPPRFADRTIESFTLNNAGQIEVATAVQQFCNWTNKVGLILIGKYGTGKTHLAVACLKRKIDEGGTGIFTTAMKLCRTVKDSWTMSVPEGDTIYLFNRNHHYLELRYG